VTESTADPAVAVSPTADFLRQARATPSFDCQAARTSIERAICSDTTLSEWDAQMGAALQNASRSKDRQPVLQSQQLRVRQRDNMCGTVAEISFGPALFEATRSRVAFEPTQAIPATTAPLSSTEASPSDTPSGSNTELTTRALQGETPQTPSRNAGPCSWHCSSSVRCRSHAAGSSGKLPEPLSEPTRR
jgi:uncharacterized protein YecT (DUF1311 family)